MTAVSNSRIAVPHVLSVDGLTVRVIRKSIKHIYLRPTTTRGHVEISVPLRVSDRDVVMAVRSRRPWLERQWDRMADTMDVVLSGAVVAGSGGMPRVGGHSPAGTRSYGEPDPTSLPSFDRGVVWSEERKRCAADAINAALPALLAKWEPIVGRSPTHITLRLMTSRWGSCTPKTGRIRLNLQLGLMEPRFLEYVLVHEMTHLWGGHGHDADFQRRMDSYLPDWRRLRSELNRRVVV